MGRHLAEPAVFIGRPTTVVGVVKHLRNVVFEQVTRFHSIIANPVGVVPYGRFFGRCQTNDFIRGHKLFRHINIVLILPRPRIFGLGGLSPNQFNQWLASPIIAHKRIGFLGATI